MDSCLPTHRPFPSTNDDIDDERSLASIDSNEQRTSTPLPSRNIYEIPRNFRSLASIDSNEQRASTPLPSRNKYEIPRNFRSLASIDSNEQRASTPLPSRNKYEIPRNFGSHSTRHHLNYQIAEQHIQQRATYLDKMTEILSKRQEEMARMRQEHDERVRDEMRRLLERLEREYQDNIQEVTTRYYEEIQNLETRRQMNDSAPHQSVDDHFDVVNTSAMSYAEFRRSLGCADQSDIQRVGQPVEPPIRREILELIENRKRLSCASLNNSDELRPDEPERIHRNDELEQEARQPLILEDEYEDFYRSLCAATAPAEMSHPQSVFDDESLIEEDVYVSFTSFASDRNLGTSMERRRVSEERADAPPPTRQLMRDNENGCWSIFDDHEVNLDSSHASFYSNINGDRMERLPEGDEGERDASFDSNRTSMRQRVTVYSSDELIASKEMLEPGNVSEIDATPPTRQLLRDNDNGCWSIFDDHEADLDHLEEQIAADDDDATAVRERKGERRWEIEESPFSSFCHVCFNEAPHQQAFFSACGNVLCQACVEKLILDAREQRRELECPFCRKRSGFVKLDEHVVEEQNVE